MYFYPCPSCIFSFIVNSTFVSAVLRTWRVLGCTDSHCCFLKDWACTAAEYGKGPQHERGLTRTRQDKQGGVVSMMISQLELSSCIHPQCYNSKTQIVAQPIDILI
jgi:hypothetical protein